MSLHKLKERTENESRWLWDNTREKLGIDIEANERDPWLLSIQRGGWSVDGAVDTLWQSYLWPWPKVWMKRWFEKQLSR